MIGLIAALMAAMAVTWFVTPFVLSLATKHGVYAIPRDRDVHTKSTPRWGGIAIYAGVICAVTLSVTYRHIVTHGHNGWSWRLVGVLIAGTFIAAVGLLDDVKELRAIWQALAILVAGAILIAFGVRIEGLASPFTLHGLNASHSAGWISLSMPMSVFGTLFWVFLVTKTVDAIDGLDGLAAGVCAISAATLALVAAVSRQPEAPTISLLAASVVGACIGFLRYNFKPARIFMSTVGAQFLGLTLAAISIMGTFKIAAAISVLVPIMVLGVPIFDYGIVLMKRLASHAPLTVADRRHLHHRLLDKGLTQKQAVWVIYCCTAVLCVAAFYLFKATR